MELVKEEPVSLAEVVVLLKKRQKDGELSYEQQNTLDYAGKFSKIDQKEARELAKELSKITGLEGKQDTIISLINVLPKKEEEIRAILAKDKLELPEDSLKEVLKVVKKFRK